MSNVPSICELCIFKTIVFADVSAKFCETSAATQLLGLVTADISIILLLISFTLNIFILKSYLVFADKSFNDTSNNTPLGSLLIFPPQILRIVPVVALP